MRKMRRLLSFCLCLLLSWLAAWPGLPAAIAGASAGPSSDPNTLGPAPYLRKTTGAHVTGGVDYWRLEGINTAGQPLVGHVLQVDPQAPLLEVRPVVAGDHLGETEKVSSLAGRYGAIGAINGSFFARSNDLTLPVGNLMIDGKLQAMSDFWRASFGLTGANTFRYGYFTAKPSLKTGSGRVLTIDNLNRPYRDGQVILYQRLWGETTGTPAGTAEVTLAPQGNGYVVTSTGNGNSPIPSRGLVLAADRSALSGLTPGAAVELDQGLPAEWQGVDHILTGGPLLVENGRPVFQAVQEGFTGSVLARRARTAVAAQKDGKMLLVVVEGSDSEDIGVTLEEMAVLLVSLGAATAVGLDGGGSSVMWVGGQLVSKPSAGSERAVANAIVVLRQIPVYLDDCLLPCDVPATLIDGRVLVPLRAIFQGLEAEVQWDQATKCVTATRAGRRLQITIGAKSALVDGRPVALDVPAQVVSGRTLVPVRLVSQALGASVQWAPKEKAVYINR